MMSCGPIIKHPNWGVRGANGPLKARGVREATAQYRHGAQKYNIINKSTHHIPEYVHLGDPESPPKSGMGGG